MKAPAKKTKRVSARTLCRKVIDVPGINKRTGQLLKGWHYVNGKPVKVTASKKKTTKKGLGSPVCVRKNQDGSSSTYTPANGTDCPYGGTIKNRTVAKALQAPRKKKATAKQLAAQKAFKINADKARKLVETGKVKTLKAAWAIVKK